MMMLMVLVIAERMNSNTRLTEQENDEWLEAFTGSEEQRTIVRKKVRCQ
jgi:hypothetical protein